MLNEIQGTKLVIQKDLGITHALEKLVENNKDALISDGKITTAEWNATMDKLAEINEKRKSEGKESIFTGKTDKSKSGWRTSFIVQKEQEIEFTKQEMNEIYLAMGVSFREKTVRPEMPALPQISAPFEVRSEVLSQSGIKIKSAPVSEGNIIPAADKNPPKIDRKHPKKDKNLPDDYTHSLKKPENIYDDQDRIIAVKNLKGEVVREITRNTDGSIIEYHDYEYNENGDLTKDITRKANGAVSEYYECEYNSDGTVNREITRRADGSVKEYYDWEYDSEGRETRSIRRNSNGKVIDYWEMEYDKNGRSKLIMKNADGTLQN